MGISQAPLETYLAGLAAETKRVRRGEPAQGWALAGGLFYLLTRLGFGVFLLLTSVYCLLVSVPFSYFGFIHNPLLSSIPLFVRLHGQIYGILVAGIALSLVSDLRNPQRRRAAIGFVVLNGCVALYLWLAGALGHAELEFASYLWSMVSLFPLLWLGVLDLGNINWSLRVIPKRINLAKTTVAAVIVSSAFSATSAWRMVGHEAAMSFARRGLEASACFHLVIFTAIGLLMIAIDWASSRSSRPAVASLLLRGTLAWVLLLAVLRTLILPTISFEGTAANIFAMVVSFVLVFFVMASLVRFREIIPLGAVQATPFAWWQWLLGALALLGAAYAIPRLLGRTDWDFVLQRIAVLVTWLLALQGVCWGELQAKGKTRPILVALLIAYALVAFVFYGKSSLYNPNPSREWQGVLEEFAGADISFRTAYDILSRPADNQGDRELYQFIKQNSNLDRNTSVPPRDIRLVSDLKPVPGSKPNIFIFVIDSLRRDYLGPYNPAVDFTPEIDRFARNSVVLQNAYTRYGGTALSEPAIWVGAMQLHKQYIEPFYPMNNLQKLLETDGYQSYISVDPILSTILHPSRSITELDQGTKYWSDLDFVSTLKELEVKIDSRSDPNKPIFVYTQPQNIHTLTLAHSKIKGGRREISIFELRRMDTAFGEFVKFLAQRGLYENSVIILTADHGDSYGEFGRWGHSDFLFPEVIRIPLIVHLPTGMRGELTWDPHQVAFTTDITPSLYYLLGHRPIINSELFGRPLFTQTPQERTSYLRPQYLIVSSYAPVYAILSGNGQSLFIVDAVHLKSYYYDLLSDPAGSHNHVSIQIENQYQPLLRQDVQSIAEFYGLHSTGK